MDADAFSLLDLPRRFDIDAAQLQAAFLRRAARIHPDRFPDPFQAAEAAGEAARLNEARAILADDERRANELLRLLGGPAKEQNDSLPDGFLMDIMEVRQDMEQALESRVPAERRRIEQWAQQQRTEYREQVRRLFDQIADDPSPPRLIEIRTLLNAWRYIERMIEQLDPSYRAGVEG